MEYLLLGPGAKGSAKGEPIRVEIIGEALKRLPSTGGKNKAVPRRFVESRTNGRTKACGWTRWLRKTVRELLERHRKLWLSVIHLVLPEDATPEQAATIFRRIQRRFYAKKIPCVGIAETPLPHFHFPLFISHTDEEEKELRNWLEGLWWSVFHRPVSDCALRWEAREEPTEAIAKYLSKSSKGGRGVKGKADWLQFTPYFTTCLPKLAKRHETLTTDEEKALLNPAYSLTFGAAVKLSDLRERAAKARCSDHRLS